MCVCVCVCQYWPVVIIFDVLTTNTKDKIAVLCYGFNTVSRRRDAIKCCHCIVERDLILLIANLPAVYDLLL